MNILTYNRGAPLWRTTVSPTASKSLNADLFDTGISLECKITLPPYMPSFDPGVNLWYPAVCPQYIFSLEHITYGQRISRLISNISMISLSRIGDSFKSETRYAHWSVHRLSYFKSWFLLHRDKPFESFAKRSFASIILMFNFRLFVIFFFFVINFFFNYYFYYF